MTNRVLYSLFTLSLPLLMMGCTESVDMGVEYTDSSEGFVSFAMTRSESGDEALLANSTLKIYSISESEVVDNGDSDATTEISKTLVRRYSPMSEMPELISLVAADYSATLSMGDYTEASFDSDKLTYYGECDFEVVAQESQAVAIECAMTNTVVRVEFDETIASNLMEGYTVTVMATDSFNEALVGEESTPQLIFEDDATGFFLLLDGVSNISWKFAGVRSSVVNGEQSAVEMTGVIENPQATEQMTLQFSYPKYLKLTESFSIYVDKSSEDYDDAFNFAPQPLISGDVLSEVQTISGDVSYTIDVDSFLDIKSVCLAVDEQLFYPFADGVAVDMDEATFSLNEGSTSMGTLTINRALFNHFSKGGDNEVKITAMDSASVEGTATIKCMTSGVGAASNFDLWNNTGSVSAIDLDGGESVKIEYRSVGSEEWIECDDLTLASDGITYSANINPVWVESKNDYGNTVYKMTSGITSGAQYECRLTVDGLEYIVDFSSSTAGNQLTNYDMSDSNPAFTSSATDSENWASGNNKYADSNLCSSATIDGDRCAKLTSTTAGLFGITKFAAGNIAYGQFDMATTSGTVSFGQPFTWTARPQKFTVRYAATLGTINYTDTSVYSGTTDRGLIYFAIVDWSGRHEVESGTSSTTGSWTPFEDTSVDKGNIIGYAYTYIDQSTASTTELYDLEMDVYYYDKTTNPTNSNISVVVSCASSAYGDYFVGSTSSAMWVDDFVIVY